MLPWGSFTIVTDQIGVARSTISRLWWQARGARKQSLIITPEIASRNNSRTNCHKYLHAEFHQGLKEIPRCRRKTYHSTAKAMGVALSTVQRMLLHRDVCHVHTSSLKPTLTEENKMSRMELALSFMDKNNTSKFENMEDLIHIDEKWAGWGLRPIRCTHRCRCFLFYCCWFFVLFDCCISLLLPFHP